MRAPTRLQFALCGLPLDAAALRVTEDLAQRFDAALTVTDVVRALPTFRRYVEIDGRPVDLQPALVDERREDVELAVKTALAGASVDVEVVSGHPVRATVELAEELGAELLVRARTPDDTGYDAVGVALSRRADVPVLQLGAGAGLPARILAAVDGELFDDEHHRLDQHVVEAALGWAEVLGASVDVVHAWDFPEESTLRSSWFLHLGDARVDELVADAERHHRRLFDDTVSYVNGPDVPFTRHLLRGEPADVVVRTAEGVGADLVVLGTVARRGLAGAVLGNTAETVSRRFGGSVLTIKPDTV